MIVASLILGLWLALAIWWLRKHQFSAEQVRVSRHFDHFLTIGAAAGLFAITFWYWPEPSEDRVYNFWWLTVLLYSWTWICVVVTLAALIKNTLLINNRGSGRAI